MFVKNLENCDEFAASDGCRLRELLHPKNDPVELPYSVTVARVEAGKRTYRHTLKQVEVYCRTYLINLRNPPGPDAWGAGLCCFLAHVAQRLHRARRAAPCTPSVTGAATQVYEIGSNLSGAGRMHVDEEIREVKEGDAILIAPDSIQWLENTGASELRFIAIVSPPWTEQDDVRLEHRA